MIVICDQVWLDPDLDARNGILLTTEEDMLRLDSKIMMVQLNVRALLEVQPCSKCGSPSSDSFSSIRLASELRFAVLDQITPQDSFQSCFSQVLQIVYISSGLQEIGIPDVNIICEKVAFEGVTRFEDRYRLPFGEISESARLSAKASVVEKGCGKAWSVYLPFQPSEPSKASSI